MTLYTYHLPYNIIIIVKLVKYMCTSAKGWYTQSMLSLTLLPLKCSWCVSVWVNLLPSLRYLCLGYVGAIEKKFPPDKHATHIVAAVMDN